MPLANFAPLARLQGVQLISLQKGFGSQQIAEVDFRVLDLANRLDEATGPFMDTAAVIGNLDLVVTADTAVAHLAGALGAAVFLPFIFRATGDWLARPRGLALVSDDAIVPPERVWPVGGRFRADRRRGDRQKERGGPMTPPGQKPVSQAELSALVELAYQYWDAGQLSEAAATFRTILAAHPDLPEAHYALGNLLVGQGQPNEAVDEFRKALALRPKYAETHNALGLALGKQGKLDEAVADFERAVARRPNYAEAWNNLGVVHATQGRLDQAAQGFEQVIDLNPNHADAHNALVHVRWRQGDVDAAAEHFERVIALRPDQAQAHANLGSAL